MKHQREFVCFIEFLWKKKSLKKGKENFKDFIIQFLSTNLMEIKTISERSIHKKPGAHSF